MPTPSASSRMADVLLGGDWKHTFSYVDLFLDHFIGGQTTLDHWFSKVFTRDFG